MATHTVHSSLDLESYSLRNMYLSVFIVETTYTYVGMMFAWTFLLIPQLETLPQISTWEEVAIYASLPLGMTLGPFTGSVLSPRYGFKSIFLQFGCLSLASVLLLAFHQVLVVCVAQVAAGIAIGAVLCYLDAYLHHISDQEVRMLLNPLSLVFFTLGLYLVYDVGQILLYFEMLLLLLTVPLVFLICMTWLPESPYFDVVTGNLDKAKKSVDFLHRGISTRGLDHLIHLIQEDVRRREAEADIFIPPFHKELKAARVSLVFFTLLSLTGFPLVFMLMEPLISEAQQKAAVGSSLSTIIRVDLCPIAVAWIINSYCNRRLKMMTSSTIMSLSLATLGIFFYQQDNGKDMGWIPLICIIVYTLAFLVGFIHKNDDTSSDFRLQSSGRVLSLSVGFFFMFLVILLFIPIKQFLGIAPILWTFSAFAMLLTVFIINYSPEITLF